MQKNTIVSVETIAEKIRKYQIYTPRIARKAKAGQFLILRLNEQGE